MSQISDVIGRSSPAFFLQLWIQERIPLASSKDYGNNLQSAQQHVKKNQVSYRGAASTQYTPPSPEVPHLTIQSEFVRLTH